MDFEFEPDEAGGCTRELLDVVEPVRPFLVILCRGSRNASGY